MLYMLEIGNPNGFMNDFSTELDTSCQSRAPALLCVKFHHFHIREGLRPTYGPEDQ